MTTPVMTVEIESTRLDQMKLFRVHSLMRIIDRNKNSTREDLNIKNRIQRCIDSLQCLDKGYFRARTTAIALKLKISQMHRHEFYFKDFEFLMKHHEIIQSADSPQEAYDALVITSE